MADNYDHFSRHVCVPKEIINEIKRSAPRSQQAQMEVHVWGCFQRAAYAKLSTTLGYDPENRIRSKQKRWPLISLIDHLQLSMFAVRTKTPRWQARRTLGNFHVLSTLTTPRVMAAALGTVFNRWNTASRFQQRNTDRNRCILRCSETAKASLEHYCRCPWTKRFAAQCLNLDAGTFANMHAFNLCHPRINTKEDSVASAILIYVIYRATQHYRHNEVTDPQEIFGALRQWAREAVFGHGFSTRVLDSRWSLTRCSTPLPPTLTVLPLPKRPRIDNTPQQSYASFNQ